MNTSIQLQKKFSIGISFYKMTSGDWEIILRKYQAYINDIFFSPIESILYQTRRNVYDYKRQNLCFLEEELNNVLFMAQKLDIARKLVLNVPSFLNYSDELIRVYEKYKRDYNLEYVTTFLPYAKRIKEIDSTQKIVCSYNQGIRNHKELENILKEKWFDTIVLGNNFIRDFEAFRLVHKYEHKIELLINNGCMPNCMSFCSLPNRYCESNFEDNLSRKDINYLFAECSIFPEELHNYLLPTKQIDYFKLSTRPIFYSSMDDMLSSYISGDALTYIRRSVTNYNLYGRLAHFHKYYNNLQYEQIMYNKNFIWQRINQIHDEISK